MGVKRIAEEVAETRGCLGGGGWHGQKTIHRCKKNRNQEADQKQKNFQSLKFGNTRIKVARVPVCISFMIQSLIR